ncbi:hypothetical protein ABTX62_04505 [Streptomyces sp. NPDC096046]|uniref:hypothetical protein n=1 Tax=Streptomyces sp. NPDC096046 TaxID=3155542 RepID=UPI0033248C04
MWQLDKPVTWTLPLSNASGEVVRTLTGTSTGAAVRAARDGPTDSGRGATGGPCTRTFSAHPRDGRDPDLALFGGMTPG